MAHQARAGRNDLCPCGSGRKFKRCCATKGSRNRLSLIMLITVGGAIVGAILLGVLSLGDDAAAGPGPGRVWSAEHGHWHDR